MNKRKKSGYKKLYAEIFEDRCKEDQYGRYVVCVKSGKKIYEHQITPHNFSHVKSKGAHPHLKYDKDNIVIMSFQFHAQEHIGGGKVHNHLSIP